MRFFASTSRGTEELLAAELGRLGLAEVAAERGGASFAGGLEAAYRACLWSRIASRVLLPLASFEAEDAAALYAGVHALDWTEHVGPERTLAVDSAGGHAPAGPGHFVALKTKDAIVDRVRAACGARPDVDTERPDLRVNVHLRGARVTVSLDLSGRGLHRREIGRRTLEAPLKETLAAAVLERAGWPEAEQGSPLYDPLCGSGTLLVEAAWIARDVAPGLARGRIGAQGWRGHDAALWARLLDEARERHRGGLGRPLRLAGSDAAPAAVALARENAARAGLSDTMRIEERELRDVVAPWDEPGLVVTNPPYGERLGQAAELGPLYELLGDVLKRRFAGWTAWVLAGNPDLAKHLGLRPKSRLPLWNGPIETRLLELPIGTSPAQGSAGPGWRKASSDAQALKTRLGRNLRSIVPWARRERLTCYRLYDADVPAYNLAVDWYDGAVRLEEYERPRHIEANEAERHLRDALIVVPELLGVDPAQVVLRVRARRGPHEQPGPRPARGAKREVREGELRFEVNLTDYLDTGLFLDDRLLRRLIHERARGAAFLNLFAYTCAASVAAAHGGARSTTSVDLSRTYLDWGRRNFALNGLDSDRHAFVRADVLEWLVRPTRRAFDLVFLAPPTWSRSRGMRGDFDVQRDHATLLQRTAELLAPGGTLLFAVSLRSFVLEDRATAGLEAREITDEITPRDFARRPRLRAWILSRGALHGGR